MKKIFETAIFATVAIMCMAACGNAGARNDNKKEVIKEASQAGVTELTNETFKIKVYEIGTEGLKYLGDKPAIVDFNATWCGPCQRIAPILNELAKEYAGQILIYKVDVDKCPEIAQAFNIQSIPALLYIPTDGKEPVMTIGARDKARFKEEIDKILLSK